MARMCALVDESRAGYYRHWQASRPGEEEMELRDAIQRLALAHRHYGYRRIGALLRRAGWWVNHKRVLRLMRKDNLLCLRQKTFVPATTDSQHSYRIYPNLARRLETTAINQLWVADITYIRLAADFVYLAVVLDAHSRRVVGWALDDHQGAPRRGGPGDGLGDARRGPRRSSASFRPGCAVCLRRLHRPA